MITKVVNLWEILVNLFAPTRWSAWPGCSGAASRRSIYAAPDRAAACARLRGIGVDYIQVASGETQADRFP